MKYRIVGWSKYQHYKERNPPWVKLHYELLTSQTWVSLDDASRVLAIACMLIASRNDGFIPNNDAYMKRVAYLNKTPNYKPLIECGFLETLADASNLHSNALPETETYSKETETYLCDKSQNGKKDNTDKRKKGSRIPSDWELDTEWGEWAMHEGLTREEVLREEQKFRDYWISQPGVKGIKTDWEATWRNWVRKRVDGRIA